MASSAVVAAFVVVVVTAGLYFAYQGGYLEELSSAIPNLENIPQLVELVEEGEPEIGESSISFLTNDVQVTYPTLFPNPRWNHMPIKVYMDVQSGSGLTGFDEEDLEYVREALKVWEEKTNGVVSFEEVDGLEEGEVIISWFPSLAEMTGGRVVGEGGPTKAIETGGAFTLLEGGEIFLLPTDNKCVGVNRPVHEMGHVLGLGHAPPGHGDIMFSKEISCKQNITQITVDAMNELYRIPAAPDLVVTNVSALKRGGLIDINFTVRNIGLVDSLQTSVGFLGDGETIESLSVPSFSVVPRISPGSGITSRITSARVSRSLSQLVLTADYQGNIAEMIEGNNEARVTFSG